VTLAITTAASLYKTRVHDVKKEEEASEDPKGSEESLDSPRS